MKINTRVIGQHSAFEMIEIVVEVDSTTIDMGAMTKTESVDVLAELKDAADEIERFIGEKS